MLDLYVIKHWRDVLLRLRFKAVIWHFEINGIDKECWNIPLITKFKKPVIEESIYHSNINYMGVF